MKFARALLLVAWLVAPLGCDYVAIQLHFSGELVVYVHDTHIGIKGTVLEVVETGDKATTDASGLAQFSLPPGRYTVRAYGINRGGPCCEFIDQVVQVDADEESRLDIWSCPTCD